MLWINSALRHNISKDVACDINTDIDPGKSTEFSHSVFNATLAECNHKGSNNTQNNPRCTSGRDWLL
jgi:hypothetical protein